MPTVNDPMTPGRVLDRLQALKAGIASTLANEDELTQARAARMTVVRRANTQREESETTTTAAQLSELATSHRQHLERAQVAFEARGAWIQSAYHNSRNSLAQRLQDRKDRRIGHVQGTILRNRKSRKEELAQATEAHRGFQELLVADRNLRHELRDSALRALRSFRFYLRPLFHSRNTALDDTAPEPDAETLHAASLDQLGALRVAVEAIGRQPLTKFFRWVPLLALALLVAVIQLWPAWHSGIAMSPLQTPLLIAEGVLLALWLLALALAVPGTRRAGRALAMARALAIAAEKASAARILHLSAEIEDKEKQQGQDLSETFRESGSEWLASMRDGQKKLDRKLARLPAKLEHLHQRNLARLNHTYQQATQRVNDRAAALARDRKLAFTDATAAIDAEVNASIQTMIQPWQQDVLQACEQLSLLETDSHTSFPAWSADACSNWTPPAAAPAAVRIGSIQVDLTKISARLPASPQFALTGHTAFAAPFTLGFPDHGSLLIETSGDAGAAATTVLNSIALRLLASLPPGRASFVFIDPVGLGRDFAGLMHLADYEETMIAHRIWTQTTQIEERLSELNEHIEKVIQMYLRNEYATIAEYNEQAGTIAEKYRFLVVAGFPAAFSETAAKRLLAIASSGARCGVHLLIHRDLRQPAPDPALDGELRRACIRVALDAKSSKLLDWPLGANTVTFDPPPSDCLLYTSPSPRD